MALSLGKLPNATLQHKLATGPIPGEAVPSLCAGAVVFTSAVVPRFGILWSRSRCGEENALLSGVWSPAAVVFPAGHTVHVKMNGLTMEGVGQSSVGLFSLGFLSWQSLQYMRNSRNTIFFR